MKWWCVYVCAVVQELQQVESQQKEMEKTKSEMMLQTKEAEHKIAKCEKDNRAAASKVGSNSPMGYSNRYSGTSINGHLIKAFIYRNAASIAGPKRPPYVYNILLYS